jgi:Zn-finger nucleic acid-binding protein
MRLATAPATASGMICPRCDLPLYEGTTSAVTLLGCGDCGGIWLDNANAQRAVASLDARVTALASRASTHARRIADRATAARCASCRAPMRRVKTTQLEVEVDVCAEHGTWFDKDELTLVLEALRGATKKRAPIVMSDPGAPLNPAEVPDFRAGQPVEWDTAAIVAGGIFTVLGALIGAAKS